MFAAAVMGDWMPYLLPAALIALLLLYLWYSFAYHPYQYFKRLGIPGPTPLPFIGNLHQAKVYLNNIDTQLCQKYGDPCGFFIGSTPILVTSDPEMLKEITIKQFEHFADRTASESLLVINHHGKTYAGLGTQQREEWKSSRHALTPAFSARKIKMMEPLISESVKRLSEKLNVAANSGESVNVSDWYTHLTLEVILATAFGRDIKVQDGQGGKVYEQVQTVMNSLLRDYGGHLSAFIALGAGLPWFTSLMRIISPLTKQGQGILYLATFLKKVVEERHQHESSRKDLLQVMLDVSQANPRFDEGYVLITSVEILLAGQETTSSALSFTSYLLALNPKTQEKLAEEVSSYLQENPNKTLYEVAQEVEYLDMVVQESLRMYSPGGMILRSCSKDCTVKGIPIKKGSFVVTPTYRMHYREDLWPEPDTFNPDRFAKAQAFTQHPCAHIPFGIGPRQCLGMRLALMETKMTLIEIVREFRILPAPETKVPVDLHHSFSVSPKGPIYLRFEPRIQN